MLAAAAIVAGGLAAGGNALPAHAQEPAKPNILVIMAVRRFLRSSEQTSSIIGPTAIFATVSSRRRRPCLWTP